MFKIYKNIFNKITGKDSQKKRRTKKLKSKPMAKKQRKKKLSPEQKDKIQAGIRRRAGEVIKYGAGKPTVKLKPAPKPAPKKQPAANFWTDTVDLGIIKPTGKQLVIGAGVTIIGGAIAYKAFK